MTNTDTRNSREGMSQTTRSSFTPLPLINKAITDSQRHNYEVITQNNRFSLSTLHACFTRVPPQITTPPDQPLLFCATVNLLYSLNTYTLTCTYTTCEYTHRYTSTKKKKTHTDLCKRLFMRACAHSHTESSPYLPPSLPPSHSSSYLAAKSSHGNTLVNLPLCSLVLINRFKWECEAEWHRARVLVSEPPPYCKNSPVTLPNPSLSHTF